MDQQITVFSNIKETSTPFYYSISDVLERIKNGHSKDLVEKIRGEKDKSKRQEFKKGLPSICFSGTFSKRADKALIEHSGIICLDFDGFKTKKAMNEVRNDMAGDDVVMAVFTSPSGDGLKVLVQIPADPDNHRGYFRSLGEYFALDEFDTSCQNESRVCYESYDPKIYINYDSTVYTDISEEKDVEVDTRLNPNAIIITDDNKVADKLMIWWEREYGFVEGKRNDNIFILASAFNDYGVSRLLAERIIGQFAQKGFTMSEIQTTINSAYTNKTAFGSKAFEDREKMDSIRRKIKRGDSLKDIKEEVSELVEDSKAVEAIIENADKQASERIQKFWKKSDRGVVSLVHNLFREFLVDHGFYKYYPEGSKNFVFVRRISNRVTNVTEMSIKDYILNYLEKNVEDMSVWDYFADKTRFFKEDFLSLLPDIEINFIEDDADSSYLFFKNVAVEVTAEEVNRIEYENLPGWVWEDQMIQRDFTVCDGVDSDFRQMIHNVAGGENDRIQSIESTIGFLLHGYKDPGYCPAVILNDEVISENPEGGTGKGIFATAVSHMKKMVEIDGKAFTFDKSFPYQTVQQDTQVLTFDDVRAHFDFERLFSVITQGITLEKKNKDAIKIPFSKSPKILITTNYAIRGSGNSFERRKWELEFKQYYTKDRTPYTEFGRRLFDDWSDDDWCEFYNYMIGNLQKWLKDGFVKSQFKNLDARKFISETSHDFYEWISDRDCDYNRGGVKYHGQDMYMNFIELYPDYGPKSRMSISRKKFYAWLDKFGEYKFGKKPETGKSANGKTIEFVVKKGEQSKMF